MSHELEMGSVKWMLIVGSMFLISCFMCYDEVAYQMSERDGEATVTKCYPTGRRGNVSMEYSWSEPEETQRKDMYTVTPSDAPSPCSKLPIIYTPGESGRSRLMGNVPWIWITIFSAALIGLGVVGFLLWREASEGDRPARRSR